MCCITLTVLEAMMTTTELARDVNYEVRSPWLPRNVERKPVRMNWVVVTDEQGQQKLSMCWNVAARHE